MFQQINWWLSQPMVNWRFGARWFGLVGFACEREIVT